MRWAPETVWQKCGPALHFDEATLVLPKLADLLVCRS